MSHHGQYKDYGGSRSAFLFHELLRQELPNGEGRKSFRKGEYIFEEGKHANGLYCVLSGKVKITRLVEGGKEQTLRLAGSRDVLGYRALLAEDLYRASAVALEDTTVGYVPKKIFFDILQSNPEMAMEMMKLLSHELERSDTKVVDIATKSVRERLAEALLLLKETYGLQADSQTLDIVISREDLAGMVGTATEVVIRQIAKLKEEGILDTRGRRLAILQPAALLKISKLSE